MDLWSKLSVLLDRSLMFILVGNSISHVNRADFWYAGDGLGKGAWVTDLARATRYTAEEVYKMRFYHGRGSYRVFWIGP